MRHGQTKLNKMNCYTGRLDYPLNAQGVIQAYEAKKIIDTLGIQRVYSSTLVRAMQTTSIVTNIKPIFLKELDERDFGVFTGRKKLQYKKSHFPQGENKYTLKNRVKKALLKMNLDNALIVSHSHVYQAICEVLGLKKLKIKNGEIARFYE